jgi:hypothetical protein
MNTTQQADKPTRKPKATRRHITRQDKRKATRSRQTEPIASTQSPKRTRIQMHSDAECIAACTAALTANLEHPTSKRGLDAAIASLGHIINVSTLHDWLKLYRPMIEPTLTVIPVEQTIADTRNKTLSNMIKARDLAVAQLLDPNKVKNAQYRDNGVVAGILDDHIEAATAIRPSLANAAIALDRICTALGFTTEDLILSHTAKLQDLQQRRLMSADKPMIEPGE